LLFIINQSQGITKMTFTTKGLLTTNEGWIVTPETMDALRKELPTLSTQEILRAVDLFKAGLILADVDTSVDKSW
jgi:hypothetical protein